MFTWICPQCGREVPPAYNECPDCAAKTAAGAAPPPGAVAPPQQPMAPAPPPGPRGRRPLWATGPREPLAPAPPTATAPPAEAPPAYQPQHAVSPMFQAAPPQAQPPQYAPPLPGGPQLPTWLMAVLSAVIFGAVIFGVYWFLNSQHSQKPVATFESPAAKAGAAENPVQKYIEVTGVRFGGSSKGVVVTFVLVNHSDTDLVGLAGSATILGRTQKSEQDPVGTVAFQTSMAAQSSKELTMPLTTKLKLVDMPDWQQVTTQVQITAPPGA